MANYAVWVKYVVQAETAPKAREELIKAGLLEKFLDYMSWPKPDVPKSKGFIHSVLSQILGTR